MRYVLRADASRSIGAGHVMRSSAIAEELIARGRNVIFVGQISGLPWVAERIACLGFSQIYENPKEFNSNPESDILILDTYEIDIFESFIKIRKWLHTVVIVDELTPKYECTLRIHPGLDSNWWNDSETPILAGPKYIPIRTSLHKISQIHYDKTRSLKIAVVAGGSDPHNLVKEIANILAKIPGLFEVSLFTTSNSNLTLDSRFKYIQVGEQLDELTRDVDLVITTASTSCLEFLARGICVGIVCAVDNQRQYYDSLGKLGVASQLGYRTLGNQWEIDERKIYSLLTSSDLRIALIAKAVGLIDFNGASRIVDAITNL